LNNQDGNGKARFSKGDAVVILIVVLVIGMVAYSLTSTNPSPSTSTSALSAVSTPTTQSSTTHISLLAGDFSITYEGGCVFPDPSTGKIRAHFYLTITNRFNDSVHYVNASLAATVQLANGTTINIPEKQIPGSPTYTNAVGFPVYFFVAGSGFEHGTATMVSLTVRAYIGEVDGPVELPLSIPIPASMTNCQGST
jgi:hypothetical protein